MIEESNMSMIPLKILLVVMMTQEISEIFMLLAIDYNFIM